MGRCKRVGVRVFYWSGTNIKFLIYIGYSTLKGLDVYVSGRPKLHRG